MLLFVHESIGFLKENQIYKVQRRNLRNDESQKVESWSAENGFPGLKEIMNIKKLKFQFFPSVEFDIAKIS